MLNPIYFLMYCTGEKASITQIEGNYPRRRSPRGRTARRLHRRTGRTFPTSASRSGSRTGSCAGRTRSRTTRPVDATCELVHWQEKMHYIDDSTGMCAGLSSFPLKPPFHIHNLPALISAGAGLDLDEESLTHLTRRNRNLVRPTTSGGA